jgi:DNA-binding protein H-NS
MPKMNLASMSVDALLKLRDEIGDVLDRRAKDLREQLARLSKLAAPRGSTGGNSGAKRGRKGRKVPAKYRSAHGETWSGRGLRPRWLTAALKEGKKLDDFLIDKRGRKGKRA